MDGLRNMNMGSLAILVGAVSAIAWIAIGGTVALVTSIIAGSLIAFKATLGADDS